MSSLLRHNQRKAQHGGGNATPRLLPRAASSNIRPSGGGGQLLIQRPVHQQKQQHQQQPQQRVQGVISMAEVMADLRILEEQQVESQRNLQNAYATKQRLLDHQDALDAKLNQCKYHYGQKRAELQRSHELLSEGQRKLMTARSAAAKADADLREFDRKLTFVRESESSLRADQRTLDRLLEEFRGQKATMDRRVQKANEQLEQAQHQFDKARHHEENLRQGIRNETASQTNLADQTAESRAESAAQEQACDHTLKLEKSLKLQVENIQKKKDDERARGANVNDDDAEDLQIGKHKQFVHQTAETKAQLKNAAAQKKAYLNQIWHETIEIQKAEGHTPSLPSTESNVPPDLDLNRIRASVQGEAEAAMDETRAKEHLKASVESLQKRLWDLTGEHSTTSDTLKELEASYEIAVKNEKDRKASNDALLAELEQVTESFKEKTRMRGELLSVQDTELAALKKELAAVSLEGCTTEENLEQSHKQCVAIDTDITNVQATYTDMKALDQNKLEDMEQELGQSRQQCRDLQEKVSRIDDRLQTNEIKEQRARRKEVDEANRKIASILEKYPDLANITINYRPDLSDSDQAVRDLKPILYECKRRSRAAEKNLVSLEEAVAKKKRKRAKNEAALQEKKERNSTKRLEKTQSKIELSKSDLAQEEPGNHKAMESVEENVVEDSAAKPRALLKSFVKASQEPEPPSLECDVDIYPANNDQHLCDVPMTQPTVLEPEPFAYDLHTTQPLEHERDFFTDVGMIYPTLTQERKVHWQDDENSVQSETSSSEVVTHAQAGKMRGKTLGSLMSFTNVKDSDLRNGRSQVESSKQKGSGRSSSEHRSTSKDKPDMATQSTQTRRPKGKNGSHFPSQEQSASDESLSSKVNFMADKMLSTDAQRDKSSKHTRVDSVNGYQAPPVHITGSELAHADLKGTSRGSKQCSRLGIKKRNDLETRYNSDKPDRSRAKSMKTSRSSNHDSLHTSGQDPSKTSRSSSHDSRARTVSKDAMKKYRPSSHDKGERSSSVDAGQASRSSVQDTTKKRRSSSHDSRGRSSIQNTKKASRSKSADPRQLASGPLDTKSSNTHASEAHQFHNHSILSSTGPGDLKSSNSNNPNGKHQSNNRSTSLVLTQKASRSIVASKENQYSRPKPNTKNENSASRLSEAPSKAAMYASSRKRTSGQTSGIPSQERASKTRRRKPQHAPEVTAKPGLDAFYEGKSWTALSKIKDWEFKGC